MAFHSPAALRALHARAGRVALAAAAVLTAAVLTAAVLTAAIAPCTASAEPPFSSSFPHLFYGADDRVSGDLEAMARFDVMSAPFWTQEGPFASRLDSLRILAPDVLRLAYVNPAGRSLPAIDDPNHVASRLAAAIDDRWIVGTATSSPGRAPTSTRTPRPGASPSSTRPPAPWGRRAAR
jgi:hypothetical protein